MDVQAIVGVGCTRGYPYYAWTVYTPRLTRAGRWVWRPVKRSRSFRSDKGHKLAFDGVVKLMSARANDTVPAGFVTASTATAG